MNKLLTFIFLICVFVVGHQASAQMMGNTIGNTANVSESEVQQTIKDEQEGKAVWDKLQNKQVSCSDLKDDDFDVLGDFFMGSMAGTNHASMNEMMSQRLGADGEKQMHIAMGKRLSGCDVSAALPQGANYFMPMMGMNNSSEFGHGMMGHYGHKNIMTRGLMCLLGFITWLACLGFLVFGSIFFWKRIHKKDK